MLSVTALPRAAMYAYEIRKNETTVGAAYTQTKPISLYISLKIVSRLVPRKPEITITLRVDLAGALERTTPRPEY